jgi:hypothetical protein
MSDERLRIDTGIPDALDAAARLAEAVPIYQDAIQPAAKEAGEQLKPAGYSAGRALSTLTEAVCVALKPLEGMVWCWKQVEAIVVPELGERFKDKLHRLITPRMIVAGPALESMKYTASEPHLQDMFIALLETAMDKETAESAHPAFVGIIKELTPDEARIVKLFAEVGRIDLSGPTSSYDKHLQIELGERAGCEYPHLVQSYIGNLDRLGLISMMKSIIRSRDSSESTTSFTPSLLPFGKLFAASCLKATKKSVLTK